MAKKLLINSVNKIKVAHIITLLELGGAQKNTLYTVSHLDKKQFSPVLISGAGGLLDMEVANIAGLEAYFIPHLVRPIRPWKDLIAFFHILFLLVKIKPSIVHTHSSKAGILGRWGAFFARVPVILHTFHGFGFNNYQRWFVRKLFILIEQITALITHRFIAVANENISTALSNKIGTAKKYTLIRSGIDISHFMHCCINNEQKKESLGITPDEKVVTTIGPFKPQKNLLHYIQLAKIITDRLDKVKFLLVGDGAERRNLEQLVSRLGIEKHVLMLGWRNDIAEILSITDIFVLTSLWEGLPRAVLEAMASGKPVVAYAVDGVKEIVDDKVTGFLISPGDINKLSEKVIFLLENTHLCSKMGKNAQKKLTEEFDITLMVKQQEKLYKEAISSVR